MAERGVAEGLPLAVGECCGAVRRSVVLASEDVALAVGIEVIEQRPARGDQSGPRRERALGFAPAHAAA